MLQNLPHGTRFVDEGDAPQLGVTERAEQREDVIDARQQQGPPLARGGAVRCGGSSGVPAGSVGGGAGTSTGASAVTAARKGACGASTP